MHTARRHAREVHTSSRLLFVSHTEAEVAVRTGFADLPGKNIKE